MHARAHIETARAIIKIIFVVYANVETMIIIIVMMMKINKKKMCGLHAYYGDAMLLSRAAL